MFFLSTDKYNLARKILLLLLISSSTIFLLSYHTSVHATNALLWKIDKTGLESSYILATMHSEDPRILKLPQIYKKIFKHARSFSAEIDLSIDNTAELTKSMMLPNNKNLKKIIGNELYNKSLLILKGFGIPGKLVNRMKPWAVLMTLSYPKPKTGLFLDKVLFDEAIKSGKKYYGLETVQEQLQIFNTTSYAHQTILLRDSIRQYAEFEMQLEQLRTLYLKGDLDGLLEFNKKTMLKGNYRIAQNLMAKLIDQRNLRMVTRMKPRLLEGNAFIAVGALHLPGEAGILQLLRDEKYKLTPVNL